MTRLVGPSHVRDAHTYGFNKDAESLAECNRPSKPACSSAACPQHCPTRYSQWYAKHKREPLPVTVGGYGMGPGATGHAVLSIVRNGVGR